MIPPKTIESGSQLTEETRDWIERTLIDHREGEASAEDIKILRELLSENQEARVIYLRFNQLECHLTAFTPSVDLPEVNSLSSATTAAKNHRLLPSRVVSAFIGAGIAALITFIFTTGAFNNSPETSLGSQPEESPLASLTSDFEAEFSGSAPNQKIFEEGAISLTKGIAQLNFRNGAQIVLEGKCGFEIIDEMTVVLTYGKIWACCPPEAHGFRVITPGGREVIDLGTEFGIEVLPQGETNVHVFDGLVKIVDAEMGSKEIAAGNAANWDLNSTKNHLKKADYGKFVTSNDLFKTRLRAHRAQMLKRDDLLLYYNFENIKGNVITNKAPLANKSSDGKIIRANRVSSRISTNGALQFDRKGSAIELNLERPKDVRQFTMAIWVNINQLPTALSSLINSDGWETGDIHFQLTRSGGLRTGINGGKAFESPSHNIELGRWHLLTATWDLDTMKAQLFCDGKKLSTSPRVNGSRTSTTKDYQWGKCRIGSWKASRGYEKDIRDLKGRIDEVMIFNRSLSQQEISKLYTNGKP